MSGRVPIDQGDTPQFSITAPSGSKPATSQPQLDPRQAAADHLEAANSHLDGRQAAIHTAMPATIVSYDGATMTAVVAPAIQGIRTMQDGTQQTVTIANIADVPVCFPGGGSHILTFPVAKGDDCMLLFNERSIDNWFQHGGPQKPSDWRMHDINDAVCFVGIRAQPHVLGKSGNGSSKSSAPQASTDTVQLRSDDGKTVVQVDGPNNSITLYASGTSEAVVFVDGKSEEVTVTAKTINLHATNTVSISAPNVTVKSGNFSSGA